LGEEDAKHICVLLKRPQTLKWREELVCSKWLNINEDTAHRKIFTSTNVAKTKTTGKELFKTKYEWGTKVSPPPPKG
jgi:HKD family nuclease